MLIIRAIAIIVILFIIYDFSVKLITSFMLNISEREKVVKLLFDLFRKTVDNFYILFFRMLLKLYIPEFISGFRAITF